MATQQKQHTAPMDEIVFENRNKAYGAYILRKLYPKSVTKASILALLIMLAGLAYPFISSLNAKGRNMHKDKATTAEMMEINKPQDDAAPPPPPPPPPTQEIVKQVKFTTPVVTTEDVVTNDNIFNQDELAKTTTNQPVVDAGPVTVEKIIEKVIPTEEDKTPPVTVVEEMPSFPGGDKARLEFLRDNIRYPEAARENGIQGKVYVQFIVDTKGNITDVKVLRGIGGGCDEEAVRAVKKMPKWNAGRQNGQTVRVLYTMPVDFVLTASN